MSLPQSQNKSQIDQAPINTKLIKGCILEGRVHEIPDRLKLWKLYDCEKGLSEDEKISLKAATCLYWFKRIRKEHDMCIYELAKKGIECLIACFKSPPEWVNDPLKFYLWCAIQNIIRLVAHGYDGTELLPSPKSAILQQNGQALLELLANELSFAMMSKYANPITVEHACLLMFLFFKREPEVPNSGWFLEFKFTIPECLSKIFSFCLFQIPSLLLCDTDIACRLIEHGMQVHPEDIESAFVHLTDDCDYKVFHKLVSNVPKSKNLDPILKNQAFEEKLNFTAIILSHSLSRYSDAAVRHGNQKINKFIKICSCKGMHPQNLKQLSTSYLTPNIRSMLLVSLWSSKELNKCKIILETGDLNENIILNGFKKYSTSILDSQLEPLYKLLGAHSSLDFCKLFNIIYNHKPTMKHKMGELYNFSLLHVTNESTVDFLYLAYTQGNSNKPRNIIIHGAVELCLKIGDTQLLREACEKVSCYRPQPKVIDSSGRSPYNVVVKLWPEKKDSSVHAEVCEILSGYKFIDPTVKDQKKQTALDYASKKGVCCINAIKNVLQARKKGIEYSNVHPVHVNPKDLRLVPAQQPKLTLKKISKTCAISEHMLSHSGPLYKTSNDNAVVLLSNDSHHSYDLGDICTKSETTVPKELPVTENASKKERSLEETLGEADTSTVSTTVSDKETAKDQLYLHMTTAELVKELYNQPPEYFTTNEDMVANEEDDDDADSNNPEVEFDEKNEKYYLVTKNITTTQTPLPVPAAEDVLQQDETDDLEPHDFLSLQWEIYICKQAADFLKAQKTSKRVSCDIKKKLYRIGEGERSRAICHRLIQPEDRLYETRLYNGARIIWCEDIQYSESKSCPEEQKIVYCDVVRVIWIALKHSVHQLNDVLQKVKRALSKSRNSEGNSKKRFQQVSDSKQRRRGDFHYPRIFHLIGTEAQETNTSGPRLHPLPNLHGGEFSVMQFHPFSSFLSVLNADPSQRECAIGMSQEEHEIISLPYGKKAIILCGRSGTGKTTTCIYRMWNEFHTFIIEKMGQCLLYQQNEHNQENKHNESNEVSHPNVPDQHNTLSQHADPLNQDDALYQQHEVINQNDKLSQQNEQDEGNQVDQQHLHQIFLTKSPILCSQVKKEFDKLVKSCTDIGFEYNRSVQHNLNAKLSDYSDEMFPLFLTSRKFLLHLDSSLDGDKFFPRDEKGELSVQLNTYDYSEEVMSNPDHVFEDAEDETTPNDNEDKPQRQCAIEVNADYFCYEIWPLISDSKIAKNLHDPLLVWTEIQSFIKGSKAALESEEGYLTKDQYSDLGRHVAPTFTKEGSLRDQCYCIFESYCKIVNERKLEMFLFDENDLIFNIYRRLQQYVVRGRGNHLDWYIDHFYIDEVQDFTQAELCLLLRCCRNPNGTFCTGDVAQNIMKGVFFRFEDLRSQFHNLAQEATSAKVPKLHSLSENFRSHSGVLNLAQSILDILKTREFSKSFQDSNLPREIAMFEGPKPILVHTQSSDELARILLGNEDESETSHELGAHQAIIVRSEEARKNLPESLKDGIVLTVLEAKGLEFNDVLLYNFFSDSQVKDQWRFLYNYIPESESTQEAKEQLKIKNLHLLRMDKEQERLKSLSAEFKHLYTAVTRARMNLWIYDEGRDDCNKPFYYHCLVEKLARLVTTSTEGNVEGDDNLMFAAPSPDEQWSKQGDYYFNLRRWKLAITCYLKGKNYQKKHATEAYQFVDDAVRSKSDEKQKEFYEKAARLFLLADKCKHSSECIEKAMKCLQKAKLHNEAAFLLEKMGKHDKALRLRISVRNTDKVIEMCEEMKDYSGLIRYLANDEEDYGRAALLKAVNYESRGIELDDDVKPQQIAYAYTRKKEGKNIDKAEALKYVSEGSVRATLLREAGRLEEAANEFLKVGHYDQAYRLFEAQGLFERYTVIKDKRTQARFLLYHITNLLKTSKRMKTTEIEELLKQLGKSPHVYYQAWSQILSGIINRSNLLLQKAIENFQRFECLPGEIFAYRSLQDLNEPIKPGNDLHNSKATCNVAEAIKAQLHNCNNTNMQFDKIHQEVLRVHDLHHNAGEKSYFISPFLFECNVFQNLKSMYEEAMGSSTQQIDEDGMVILDKSVVDKILMSYYSQMSCDFLKSQSHFKKLPGKIISSQFHTFLKTPSVRVGRYLSHDLDNYFKNLKELLEYSYLTKEAFDFLDNQTLFRLFSPDVAIYLNITRKNMGFLKRNSKCVSELMTKMAKEMLDNPDHNTLQTYITAFRLLTIFVGKYDAKRELTEVMKSPSASKYVFTNEKSGKEMYVFNGWFITHENIQKGEMMKAAESAYFYFLKRIANLEEGVRNEALSISTVNYIVSIMSTALLTILQSVDFQMVYVFPRYYEMLLRNFDIFCSKSILSACLPLCGTAVQGTTFKYLNLFLSYLLGKDGSTCKYSVLYTALTTESCLQDGSAFFCLVNSLILASNLYCAAHDKEKIHTHLVSIHKIVRDSAKKLSNDSKPEFLMSAVDCLAMAKSTSDIFSFICDQLQQHHQMSDLMKTVYKFNQHGTVEINHQLAYRREYPDIYLRALVIIEKPSGESISHVSEDDVPSPTEKEIEFIEEEEERADKNFSHSISAEDPNESSHFVSNDYCNVCGVVLVQGESSGTADDMPHNYEDYATHLKSRNHKANIDAYEKYNVEKERVEKEVSSFSNDIEELHDVNPSLELSRMITNLKAVGTQQQSVHKDTMKLSDWARGTSQLLKCVEKLRKYKKQYNRLKSYYENRKKSVQMPEEEEDEILPVNTGPPKLSKAPKKSKKKHSKPKHQ